MRTSFKPPIDTSFPFHFASAVVAIVSCYHAVATRGVIADCLQILLMSKCLLCDSWSAIDPLPYRWLAFPGSDLADEVRDEVDLTVGSLTTVSLPQKPTNSLLSTVRLRRQVSVVTSDHTGCRQSRCKLRERVIKDISVYRRIWMRFDSVGCQYSA